MHRSWQDLVMFFVFLPSQCGNYILLSENKKKDRGERVVKINEEGANLESKQNAEVGTWMRSDLCSTATMLFITNHIDVSLFNESFTNERSKERTWRVYAGNALLISKHKCNYPGFLRGHFPFAYLSFFVRVHRGTCVCAPPRTNFQMLRFLCFYIARPRFAVEDIIQKKETYCKPIMLALTHTRLHKDAWINTHAEYVPRRTDCNQEVCSQMTSITHACEFRQYA